MSHASQLQHEIKKKRADLLSQIFVRYPFTYFWLETGSYKLIFILLRASKQNDIEIWGPQSKMKVSYGIKFSTFSKVRKYENKYRTKICDFTEGIKHPF